MTGLRFAALGPLRVWGETAGALTRPSHRRLLSILLLEVGRRQTTDLLIDRYWGECPPTHAKTALQTHVSALRRLLGQAAIITEGHGYRLAAGDHWIDLADFVDLSRGAQQQARGGHWETALEDVERALGLWRGDPFPDLRDDDFARPEIARLQESHAELLELRAQSMLQTGRAAELLPDLERLVIEQPLRERLWEHLMVGRAHLGRHAEALAAYREAGHALSEVGLEPGPGLRDLERSILRHEGLLTTEPRHNLPVDLTSFIGRDRERGDVVELLRHHRLVTLTGVGGAGKTRLALRAAADRLDAFPDGCWSIHLAPLRDPKLVEHEVVTTLGLQLQCDDATTSLQAAVASQTMLIVLDNCEHLLSASAELVRALLEAGTGVTVITTSREPLGVPGEVVYEVPPMAMPADEPGESDALRSFDAVRLFEDRAGHARPGYRVDDRDASAVVAICQRLDGVPLAIELAAARMRALDAHTIADRLDDRFELLSTGGSTAPARQRTLEAAVAWSYDLLAPAEQQLFVRLSVFSGGFDLEMAEQVCCGDSILSGEVMLLLTRLVDRSLVAVLDSAVGRRYRLLETLHAFAAERLQRGGEVDEVRQRHADWCTAFATEVSAPGVLGSPRVELMERLAIETDNLRAALEWSSRFSDPGVAHLASALALYWSERRHLSLAITHLEQALAVSSGPEVEADLRSRLGRERFAAGDVGAALEHATRAFELISGSCSSATKAAVLARYAQLHLTLIDHAPRDAIPIAREAVLTAETVGEPTLLIRTRSILAEALGWTGRVDEALDHQRTALELALAVPDRRIALDMFAGLFTLLYLHPTERRDAPRRLTDALLTWNSRTPEPWDDDGLGRLGWPPYTFIQSGEWERAEEVIDRISGRHLEGFDKTWHLMLYTTLRWMQGRLDEARVEVDELRSGRVNPRWYHDYYPLLAEILADQGRLPEVRALAEEHLGIEVDPSEEAAKLAVLGVRVRAEIDAAVDGSVEQREEHTRAADRSVARMRALLASHPPPTEGGIQLETPRTYLAFAEAELSRATQPDPDGWRKVAERADYAYYRIYACWRRVEALVAGGNNDAARSEVREVLAEARRVGAGRIRDQLEVLMHRVE